MVGNPTPTPVGGHETPSAGIDWKLFLLIAGIIGAVFFAGMAMQSDGDSAPADADSPDAIGQGSGQDRLVAVETESDGNKNEVSVQHIMEPTNPLQVRTGVLYTYESSILKTPTLSKPYIIGVMVIDKDKCTSLEFEGRKFSDVTMTLNEYGGIDITGYVEVTSKYSTSVDWGFTLLSKDREVIGSSMMHSINPFGEEDGEFNISIYITNVDYNIDDVKFVAIALRRTDERLEEEYR